MIRLEPRERGGTERLAGDARDGAANYKVHCASCHGLSGDGQGPFVDGIFPPIPRDHTDGGYMSVRTDEDLFKAIKEGGPAVNRSRLMPPFNEKFDDMETWNLVAWLRALHPAVEEVSPPYAAKRYHEVVLSVPRTTRIEQSIGRRLRPEEWRLVFYSVHDGSGSLVAYVLFPTLQVRGVRILLAVAVSPALTVQEARTHHRVVLDTPEGQDRTAVDRVCASLRGRTAADLAADAAARLDEDAELGLALGEAVRLSLLQIQEALGQDEEDRMQTSHIRRTLEENPESLPRGQRTYLRACADCHGVLGRPIDLVRDYKPRSLSDAAYMGRISDEYLDRLLRLGGRALNVSPVMPSFSFSDDERAELIAYVRSLSLQRSSGLCPCEVTGNTCGATLDGKGRCPCCGADAGGKNACPLIKR